ncbi:uncharacterized protein LOC131303146 [Rhododendron vialii]|uniref:uncharacterized protein LOC131303146 n=1 Tax=Rhododendron vialii TaxID=182163 RepID=UPI00265DA189|nr:uncharacterized protein LOC131303146 [Rhododendron vialii]
MVDHGFNGKSLSPINALHIYGTRHSEKERSPSLPGLNSTRVCPQQQSKVLDRDSPPTPNGRLGVKRMLQQNLALLAKWWWRYGNNKESIWAKVIREKYGLNANCWLPYTHGSGSTSKIWADICSLEDPSSHLGYSMRKSFRIKVNSGNSTLFWEHTWLGETLLKEEFSRVFLLSDQKEEMLSHSNNALLGSLWKKLCSPKVEVFAWMAVKEKAATRSLLLSRNIISEPQSTLCPFCSMHLETHQHLFIECHFSWTVWSTILDWWKVKWACPASVPILASWWLDNGYLNLEKHIWESCFYATLWSIWLVRNDYIFNNSTTQPWEVGDVVKTRVAMWMKAKFNIKIYTVEDFKKSSALLDFVMRGAYYCINSFLFKFVDSSLLVHASTDLEKRALYT